MASSKIPIDISFNSEQSVKQLQADLRNALKSVPVGLDFSQQSVNTLINKLQTIIDQQAIQLLDKESNIDVSSLKYYLGRLFKEINKQIGNDPKLRVHLNFDVDTSLDDLKAKLDSLDVSGFQQQLDSIVQAFNSGLDTRQMQNFVSSFSALVRQYTSSAESLSDETDAVVDAVIDALNRLSQQNVTLPQLDAQILSTLRSLRDVFNDPTFGDSTQIVQFIGQLNQALADFNGGNQDFTALADLITNLNDLNTTMGDAATAADTLMGGEFGNLLTAANNTQAGGLIALTNALAQLTAVMNNAGTFAPFTQGLQDTVDAVQTFGNTMTNRLATIVRAINVVTQNVQNMQGGGPNPIPTPTDIASAFDGHIQTLTTAIDTASNNIVQNGRGGGGGARNRSQATLGLENDIDDIINQRNIGTHDGFAVSFEGLLQRIESAYTQAQNVQGNSQRLTAQRAVVRGLYDDYVVAVRDLETRRKRAEREFESTGDETEYQRNLQDISNEFDALKKRMIAAVGGTGNGFSPNDTIFTRLQHASDVFEEFSARTSTAFFSLADNLLDVSRDLQVIGMDLPESLKTIVVPLAQFPKMLHSIGQTIEGVPGLGAVGRAGSRFVGGGLARMGMSTALAGTVGTMGVGLVAGAAVAAGSYFWAEWEAKRKRLEASKKMEIENQKYVTDLKVKDIKRVGEIEAEQIKSATALETQRYKNQTELRKLRMEINAADLETQQRLYEIELERTKAQKESEVIQKRSAGLSEIASTGFEYNNRMAEKRTSATYVGGIRSIFGLLNIGETEAGELVDSRIMKAAAADALGKMEDFQLESMMRAAENAERSLSAFYEKNINTMVAQQQSVFEKLTALEGASLTEDLQKRIGAEQTNNENLVKNQTDEKMFALRYGRMLQMSLGEALNNGFIQKDVMTGQYMTKDEKGNAITLGKTNEEASKYFEMLRATGAVYIQAYNAQQKSNEEQIKKNELLLKEAEAQKAVTDAYLKQQEAFENYKKELRDNLFDQVKQSWNDFSGWAETTNESRSTSFKYWEMIARQTSQLKDPRLLAYPSARKALELKQEQDKAKLQEDNKLLVKVDNDLYKQRKDHEEALFRLRKTMVSDMFTTTQEGFKRISDAQLEAIRQQKEVALKLMDTALAKFKLQLDPYGQNRFNLEKELKNIKIEIKYNDLIAQQRSVNARTNAEWENERAIDIQKEVNRLKEENLITQQSEEKRLLEIRQKLEKELLQNEFKIRLEQIKYEVEYRAMLEQQQLDKSKAGWEEWYNGLGDVTNDELNLVGKKNVDQLTEEERRKVVSQLTEEDRQKIGQNRAIKYQEDMRNIIKTIGDTVVTSLNNQDLEQYLDAQRQRYVNMSEQEINKLSKTDKELREAIIAVVKDTVAGQNEGTSATLKQQTLVQRFNAQNTRTFGAEYSTQEYAKQIQGFRDELKAVNDAYNEVGPLSWTKVGVML